MVVWEAWNDQTGIDPFTHEANQAGPRHARPPEGEHQQRRLVLTRGQAEEVPDLPHQAGRHQDFHSTLATSPPRASIAALPTITPGPLADVRQRGCPATPAGRAAASASTRCSTRPAGTRPRSSTASPRASSPCGLNTGISYPLANGAGFDSAQLGPATPAVRAARLEHAHEPEAGNVHVLLPDPPVHARGVPDHPLDAQSSPRAQAAAAPPRVALPLASPSASSAGISSSSDSSSQSISFHTSRICSRSATIPKSRCPR